MMTHAHAKSVQALSRLFSRGPMAAALAALLMASPAAASLAYADATTPSGEMTSSVESATPSGIANGTSAANNPLLEQFSQIGSIEETVLVDESGVKITATGLTYEKTRFTLDLLIENNTSSSIDVRSGTYGYPSISINGFTAEGSSLSADVAAGKKARESVRFSYDTLQILGIREVADIGIAFHIESEDGTLDFYTAQSKLATQLASTYDYTRDFYQEAISSDTLKAKSKYTLPFQANQPIYDVNGVSAVSQALVINKNGSTSLTLEFLNTTDAPINLRIYDVTINGLVCSSGLWDTGSIAPGAKGTIGIRLSNALPTQYWAAYGIGNITSVDFKLSQTDADFANDIAEKVPVHVEVSSEQTPLDASGTVIYDNEAGIRIISKGFFPNAQSNDGDIDILLLAENLSGSPIELRDVSDSASVNGYMIDVIAYDKQLADGQSGMLRIPLDGSKLTENGIAGIDSITDFEISYRISGEEGLLDEPMLTITPTMESDAGEGTAGQVDGEAEPTNLESSDVSAASGDVTPDATAAEDQPADTAVVTPEFKTMMDEYEAFMNSYVDFVITYTSSDDMLGMLNDYTNLVKQEVEWANKVNAVDQSTLSAADAAYYIEVTARVSQRLLEIA